MTALRTLMEGSGLALCIWLLFLDPSHAATRLPDMASSDAMTLAIYMMILFGLAVAIIAKHFSRRPE